MVGVDVADAFVTAAFVAAVFVAAVFVAAAFAAADDDDNDAETIVAPADVVEEEEEPADASAFADLEPLLLPLELPLAALLLPRTAARWLSRMRLAPRSLRKSRRAFCGFGSSLPSDSRMSAWTSALGRGGAGDCSAAQNAL